MPAAAPWSTRLAQDLITAEIAAARSFYGDDGLGATALLPILHALQRSFGHVPAQAVPVLGAVSGAALNAAYLGYYREMARIRFALMRLTVQHGAEAVLTRFSAATAPPRLTESRPS